MLDARAQLLSAALGFVSLRNAPRDPALDRLHAWLDFTLCGAQVIGASNAKSALAILETHVLDAIVVDLRMPREDGWWLLRQLRASETASAQAPVYAISGERHEELDPASGFAG